MSGVFPGSRGYGKGGRLHGIVRCLHTTKWVQTLTASFLILLFMHFYFILFHLFIYLFTYVEFILYLRTL